MAANSLQPVIKPNRKIDVAKAIELRMIKGLSLAEVGKYFDVSKQAVKQATDKFLDVLQSPEILDAYRTRKVDMLESVELILLRDLLDHKRRKEASLNNVAYALQNVNNIARLEKGQATEIHEHRLDPEYIKVRKAEIVTELQARGLINPPQDVVL